MPPLRDLFTTPPMPDRFTGSFTESLTAGHSRSFYEGHRSFALMMILILFLSPFAGLYVMGLLGSVIGVLLSVVAYYVVPSLWRLLGR